MPLGVNFLYIEKDGHTITPRMNSLEKGQRNFSGICSRRRPHPQSSLCRQKEKCIFPASAPKSSLG